MFILLQLATCNVKTSRATAFGFTLFSGVKHTCTRLLAHVSFSEDLVVLCNSVLLTKRHISLYFGVDVGGQTKEKAPSRHTIPSDTMAEGSVTALRPSQVPAMAPGLLSLLTEEERRQVEEYQKILQFQDRVLSGAHPSIKVPSHLFAPKQSSEPRSSAFLPASAQPSSLAQGGKSQTGTGFGKPPPKGPKLSRANATMPTNGTGPQSAANLRSFGANAARSAPVKHTAAVLPPGLDTLSSSSSTMAGIPTGPRADAGKRASDSSANAQFDPVLLTKSEDLIKAEFHLQRQRLERTLADQLQQHRAATKAANTIEAPVDFDLASVLMQALLRAQSSALPQTDANLAANQSRSESDSNATFYSSKHDTPESHLEQRIPGSDEAEAMQDRDDSPYEPPMVMDASSISAQAPVVAMPPPIANNSFVMRLATEPQHQSSSPFAQPPASFANAPTYAPTHDARTTHISFQGGNNGFGGRDSAQEASGAPIEITSSQESGEGSSSRNSGVAAGDQPSAQSRLESDTRQMIEQAFGRHQSPILRAHNLSPIAPQPAHVSPLATSRQPPIPRQDAPQGQATSAQIAALRADHSNGSSPDSSPQGKASRKGKKNSKKRKADRMAANNAPAPYIKPEPRSPSPLTAPQYPRQPSKRMRAVQQQSHEQGTNETRYEEVAESAHPSSYPPRFYRDDRGPAYGSPAVPSTPQDTRVVVIPESPRYERQYYDELRPVRYIRRASPGAQSYTHPSAEVRTYRSVSRAAIDPPYSYHDPRDQPRTVIRPAADRERSRSPVLVEDRAPSAMGPPQLPATRVFLDETGREYLEPPSRQEPVVVRRSVASRPVYGSTLR